MLTSTIDDRVKEIISSFPWCTNCGHCLHCNPHNVRHNDKKPVDIKTVTYYSQAGGNCVDCKWCRQ